MQMELGVPQILSLFLVVAGVGVIVLGFFKNFGRQVQKIKIQRFGIDMELSTMGLWLVLGLVLCAGGVYVSRQPGASVVAWLTLLPSITSSIAIARSSRVGCLRWRPTMY